MALSLKFEKCRPPSLCRAVDIDSGSSVDMMTYALRSLTPVLHEISLRTVMRSIPVARSLPADQAAFRPGSVPPLGARSSFFHRDGNDHHWLRAFVANTFTPRSLSRMAGKTQRIADGLLNSIAAGQPVDLVASYARPLAGKSFCELVGIPVNRESLLAVTLAHEAFLLQSLSEMEAAVERLLTFARELIEIKRHKPGDDLYTDLLRLHETSKLTEDELTSTYILLMIGGMEAATVIESAIFCLLTHPDQLAMALADPDLFTDCVDEVVRYENPFRFLVPRFTTAPLELGTVTIPAGELLMVSPAAGNRDPRHFQDPDVFDITRTDTGNLGFGHGTHRCPGAQLAKIEVTMAIRTFFERFPATELVGSPGEADWIPGKHQRRLETLRVVPA